MLEYTVAEYAAMKNVATNTVYVWIKSGKIAHKKIGKLTIVLIPENG